MKHLLLAGFILVLAHTSYSQNYIYKDSTGRTYTKEEVISQQLTNIIIVRSGLATRKDSVPPIPPSASNQLLYQKAQNYVINKPAPDFNFTDFENKSWNNKLLKGNIIILYFWNAESISNNLGDINKLADLYKSDKVVWLAPTPNDNAKIASILKTNNLQFHIIPSAIDYCKSASIYSFPAFLVIDANGTVNKSIYGSDSNSLDLLKSTINSLLKK